MARQRKEIDAAMADQVRALAELDAAIATTKFSAEQRKLNGNGKHHQFAQMTVLEKKA